MTADTPTARPVEPAPRIQIRSLNKVFKRRGGGSVKPVDDINLTVGDDELVVLLGPSGCGKTTLLRCVAGLEMPDSGEITINGETVFCSRRGIFVPPERRNLSMIFQSFALWPHMTVAENVAYPLQSRGVSRSEVGPRVQAALDLVGIGDLGAQIPAAISGGQQQRVALARALVSGSSVVLFDEPLSSVDAKVREQLRAELARMQRKLRFSGLYVTHDQTEAMELGDRVAVLQSGRIAALGPPREVYRNPPSEYVATFVGAANVWRAQPLGQTQGGWQVRMPCGDLQVGSAPDQPAPPVDATGHAALVARPEDLILSASPPDDPVNAIEVTVETISFVGPHTQYLVAAQGLEARIWGRETAGAERLTAGGRAWMVAPADRLRLVTPGDRAGGEQP